MKLFGRVKLQNKKNRLHIWQILNKPCDGQIFGTVHNALHCAHRPDRHRLREGVRDLTLKLSRPPTENVLCLKKLLPRAREFRSAGVHECTSAGVLEYSIETEPITRMVEFGVALGVLEYALKLRYLIFASLLVVTYVLSTGF